MKRRAAALLISTLAAETAMAPTAMAQSVDIATITCADLADMPSASVEMLLTWIDGYMGGQASDTGFDVERLLSNIDGAATLCGENPDATLMDVLHQAENG